MSAITQTARIVHLLIAQERTTWQAIIFNGVVLPVTIAYLGARVIDDPASLRIWAAGAIAMALGMNGLAQVGFTTLVDRFGNRISLLQTSPVSKFAYYGAHLVLATGESLLIVVASLVLFAIVGVAHLTAGGMAAGVLAAVCAGPSLGALGAALAFRARDFDAGSAAISMAALGLSLASPVLYSIESVPGFLRPVCFLSPFTYIAGLLRAAVAGTATPMWAVGGCIALTAAMSAVSYRWLRWQAE